MKNAFILVLFATVSLTSFAQKKAPLELTNALVIGQLDNPEDRYSLEINFTELLTSYGVKAEPSLNHIKFGEDSQVLGEDSLIQIIKSKGINTYALVSVRGYDKRFKKTTRTDSLPTALSIGSLFDLYREDIVSISFEFKFYRNGIFVYTDIVKCGNIGDRSSVIKRFRKKTGKRIAKKWIKK
tara:strand:- start:1946 stop:2494 length:549 start_codon:yes stop_codon:yes gene_type:complete